MPTYNGYDVTCLVIGSALLVYAIYVLAAPLLSDDGQPLAKPRVWRGVAAIVIAAWFFYVSPVDPDNPRNSWGLLAIVIRLGIFRGVWWMIDRHYDPMAEKRKHGAFPKR